MLWRKRNEKLVDVLFWENNPLHYNSFTSVLILDNIFKNIFILCKINILNILK